MRIYTVKEAAEIRCVPEIEIIDAIRTGEIKATDAGSMGPSFPAPFTTNRIRHRDHLRISADELDQIHPDLCHRWQLLSCLGVAEKQDALDLLKAALTAWYGAALDDPNDREAWGVIDVLESWAMFMGAQSNGTIVEQKKTA
ncbi:hypothetical protein [Sandarakinorhabdus sp.]|uniref:hypothetical protein n=1 Tax=Sandarakinorhabdus sp. TaxID=1916663 RepID=UPI003F70A4D2